MQMVDEIAWPKKAKPEMAQGVAFFNLMRNLTATGFYTSEIGGKDVGYMGNVPNQWNGVPADVLKQYGIAYTEKELKECVSYQEEFQNKIVKISLPGAGIFFAVQNAETRMIIRFHSYHFEYSKLVL